MRLGDEFTYTVTIANEGTDTSQGIELVQTLPEGVSFVSSNLTPSQQEENTLTFAISDLAQGESTSVEITVTAPTAVTGDISTTASVTSDTFDPDASNDFVNLTTSVISGDSGDSENNNLPTAENDSGVEFTTDENTVITLDVLGNDSDPDAGDRITITAIEGENVSLGNLITLDSEATVTVNGDGTFNYNPNGAFEDLDDGETDTDTFTYTVSDGNGGADNAEVTITINGETDNLPPELISNPEQNINENETEVFTVEVDAPDADDITFSLSGGADEGLFSMDTDGNLSFNEAPDFETPADTNADNVYEVQVTASDSNGLTATQDLIIQVENDPDDDEPAATPANADLELELSADTTNTIVDQEVAFTLTLTNNGPGTASGIQVQNLLPPELTFVSATPEQGTYDSETGIWDVGNIRDNLSRTLNLVAIADTKASTEVTAEVTAVAEADPDSIPNNNNRDEDDFASLTIFIEERPDQFSLSLTTDEENNIFTVGNNVNLVHTLEETNNATNVNEIGIFILEPSQTLPDPNNPTEVLSAFQQGQIIFSALPDQPENGEVLEFNTSLTRSILQDDVSGQQIAYFSIEDTTLDSVIKDLSEGETNILERVQFGSEASEVENIDEDEYLINFLDGQFSLNVESFQSEFPLGIISQGKSQKEIFDLRADAQENNLEGQTLRATLGLGGVQSIAAFDNLVGLYIVDDTEGGIDTNDDGVIDITPGDEDYTDEIFANAVEDFILKGGANVEETSADDFSVNLVGGTLLVPFIIARGGNLDAVPASTDELPLSSEVYTPYIEGNSDRADHFRLLGDNTFGIEDLRGGGDQDFNDIIFQVQFETA